MKFDDTPLPDFKTTPPEVWNSFLTKNRPFPRKLSAYVLRMNKAGQHKHVISCLRSALINGQAQPWMYELLAISMEYEKYPEDEIERVALSLTDFGEVDFGSLMYSGALLTGFKRPAAAFNLYRQASRMLPERPEPYVMGLNLARDTKSTEDIRWAASGILQNCWTRDYEIKHASAMDAVNDQARTLRADGDTDQLQTLMQSVRDAQIRDVMIEVTWTGKGDLDLYVEEPRGTICSFENPETRGGGIHLHDGCGPDKSNCYERYVCPLGVSGTYRLQIKKAWGDVTANRCRLKVTTHMHTPDQKTIEQTLVLKSDEASFTFDLDNGRRTQPREGVSFMPNNNIVPLLSSVSRTRTRGNQGERATVREQFEQDRVGAFGFSPVIQTIPEGSSLSGQVVISPDRRYVRIGIQPVFSNVTDVFTFSFINGN